MDASRVTAGGGHSLPPESNSCSEELCVLGGFLTGPMVTMTHMYERLLSAGGLLQELTKHHHSNSLQQPYERRIVLFIYPLWAWCSEWVSDLGKFLQLPRGSVINLSSVWCQRTMSLPSQQLWSPYILWARYLTRMYISRHGSEPFNDWRSSTGC